jgi:serine/threonine protein kinase
MQPTLSVSASTPPEGLAAARRPRPPARAARPAPTLGKYRLCSRLDGGGQAELFLALTPDASRPVVLKWRPFYAFDPAGLATDFLDEARLAMRLDHPNVVRTHAVGVGADGGYLAMELLEGQALADIGPSPRAASVRPAVWARVVADALSGLDYAHELCDFDGTPLALVHRDVSPPNIFVTYEGRVVLLDFGIAKASINLARTKAGLLKGKVGYMAPEQINGRTDRRSDVFAMGVILWELLAGRTLFTGDLVTVMRRVMTEPVPPPSSVRPELDPRLDAIVARAVEKDPAARYPTARAMRQALEAYLAEAGDPVRAEELGGWLREAFAGDRAQLRAQVHAALAAASHEPSGRPPPDSSPSLKTLTETAAPAATPPGHGPAPRRPRATAWALFGVAVFGLVAAISHPAVTTALSNRWPQARPAAPSTAPPTSAPHRPIPADPAPASSGGRGGAAGPVPAGDAPEYDRNVGVQKRIEPADGRRIKKVRLLRRRRALR